MGAVYEAFDLREWRRVALKKIEPQSGQSSEMFEERFEREVRALAGIKHPGVPTLYGSGRTSAGAAYYTMEIIAGERLRKLLEGGALEPIRALSHAIELGRALAAAHEAGVVHRDVKPGNVLIEPGGQVRLIDFGACSFLPHFFAREEMEADHITATVDRWATSDLDVVATPGYSAPEISRRDEDATPRADIYSVCAILYEMIQGRPLFDRQAHCDRTISPDEFPPHLAALAEILARGASHETYERPKSMSELVQALEVLRTGVSRDGAGSRARTVGPTPRRSWWVSAGLGGAAVALVAVAWFGEGATTPRDAGPTPSVDVEAGIRPATAPIDDAGERPPPPPAPAEPAEAVITKPAVDTAVMADGAKIKRRKPRHSSSGRVGRMSAAGRPDSTVALAVRACDSGRTLSVSVNVDKGRGSVVTINMARLDPKDEAHRCVRDVVKQHDFSWAQTPRINIE